MCSFRGDLQGFFFSSAVSESALVRSRTIGFGSVGEVRKSVRGTTYSRSISSLLGCPARAALTFLGPPEDDAAPVPRPSEAFHRCSDSSSYNLSDRVLDRWRKDAYLVEGGKLGDSLLLADLSFGSALVLSRVQADER